MCLVQLTRMRRTLIPNGWTAGYGFRGEVRAAGGFGDPVGMRKVRRKKRPVADKKMIEEAMRSAEEGRPRPIDVKEAAKGRIDYATVKDWGDGKEDIKLEDLEIKNIGANPIDDDSLAFYIRLTKILEMHSKTGALEIETERLKPFGEWEYEAENYGIVVANLMITFKDTAPLRCRMRCLGLGKLKMEAMVYLSNDRKLNRGMLFRQDYENYLKHTPDADPLEVQADETGVAYDEYIKRLAKSALDFRNLNSQIEACCKLIAHAYVLRVMHFTSGVQIASVAVEKVNLVKKQAASAYQDYPIEIKDPVYSFIEDVNTIGELLREEQKQLVFYELPTAFKMGSILYAPLARYPKSKRTSM